MEHARGVTIHVPDIHTRYDITQYAIHYDAVAGRRFYFWIDTRRTAVLTVVLALKHILQCQGIVLPKERVNEQLKTCLCRREARRITANNSQLHLKNEQYSNDQFVDQGTEMTTYCCGRPRFCPPPRTKKTCVVLLQNKNLAQIV